MFHTRYWLQACAVTLCVSFCCHGQTLKVRTPEEREKEMETRQETSPVPAPVPPPVTVDMNVPAGTPIKVALDSEVRVRRVGQPIYGKTIGPVYAFDKLLIPAGTAVTGKISAIDGVPKRIRTLEAMDGNFSPTRAVHVEFDELQM